MKNTAESKHKPESESESESELDESETASNPDFDSDFINPLAGPVCVRIHGSCHSVALVGLFGAAEGGWGGAPDG